MSSTSLSPSELFVNKTTYYFFQGSLVGTHKSDAFLYESYDLTFHLKYVSLQCVQVCDPPIESLRIDVLFGPDRKTNKTVTYGFKTFSILLITVFCHHRAHLYLSV